MCDVNHVYAKSPKQPNPCGHDILGAGTFWRLASVRFRDYVQSQIFTVNKVMEVHVQVRIKYVSRLNSNSKSHGSIA